MRSGSIARFVPIAAGVIAIVAIGRFSDRLRRWLDRRFFRDAYDAEQILSEVAAQVRTIVETQPLLETVSRQISTALHVPRMVILLNDGGMLQPAYALGYGQVQPVRLLRTDRRSRRMRSCTGRSTRNWSCRCQPTGNWSG